MRKVIRRSIRRRGEGVDVVSEIQGVVVTNVGKPGTGEGVSKRSRVRVVQRGDGVDLTEEEGDTDSAPPGRRQKR